MIEFNGYISGNAEKRFYNKSRNIVQNAFLFAMLLLLPVIVFISYKMRSWTPLGCYCIIAALIPLSLRIPKSKKEKLAMLPKRIYVEDECIICVAKQYTESRLIEDVKQVIDHGEYYELIFPFGKGSEKFICQKDLLSKGSLAAFEALFKGKIRKKSEEASQS